MPQIKVPAGTDKLAPEAIEGWHWPRPASVAKAFPVPASPLIGRITHGLDWNSRPQKYMILRVNGNKTERERTPELCRGREHEYSISAWVAPLVSPQPLELGPQELRYIRLSEIAPLIPAGRADDV